MKYEYKIYHITNTHDTIYSWMRWDELTQKEFSMDDYHFVYSGEIEFENDTHSCLNELFRKFNLYHPLDYKSHSMSVSDVVSLMENGSWKWYYCDSWGWKDITDIVNKEEERCDD